MAIALYMDVHIPMAITAELRLRGVDVLTAQEDNSSRLPDTALLDRTTTLQRVLFTYDRDFLSEGTQRQKQNINFNGIIYSHPLKVPIGICINDLEILAKASDINEFTNRIEYLPL